MKQTHIYNDLVRFYNHSRRKLQSLVVEGKNFRKQSILQKRIARLFKTLTGLQRALKLGMAAAALSAGMLLFQPNAAQAQITFGGVQTNPFGLTASSARNSIPAFVDLDGDGDMDIIVGERKGLFDYFHNTGTAAAPDFAGIQTNPFGLIHLEDGYNCAPAFADLDGDGDMDLITGEHYVGFFYFQNTGTAIAPSFAAPQANPFGLTNMGSGHHYSTPVFVDLDGDGDMDLIAGESGGGFFYFQNTGTAAIPAFAAKQSNPFGLTDIGSFSTPAFADLDHDGDMDLLAGEYGGNFFYFQNTGTAAVPAFTVAQMNPFGLADIGSHAAPSFADLDGQGDMDLLAGEYSGSFLYFQNTTCSYGLTVFADADGDHFGDPTNSLFVADCIVPDAYVFNNTDCNDNPDQSGAGTHPGACDAGNGNGIDDNCDGVIDNGFGATTYYADADGDGFGAGNGTSLCNNPGAGYSINNVDCNDANGTIHPLAVETSNGIDDDCNGIIDDVPIPDTWAQKANFAGTGRCGAAGFSIGNKGYIGTGQGDSGVMKDFWEYDPFTDTWTQKADFGGAQRRHAVGLSIGNKGYIGTGDDIATLFGSFSDFWEYDPATNIWTKKASLPSFGRSEAIGFSIGDKGYIGTGFVDYTLADFWEYDPAADTWTQKANFGGGRRSAAIGFSVGGKGYIGSGWAYDGTDEGSFDASSDFWEYDPATNVWTQKADFAGGLVAYACGLSIGAKGYVNTGDDFWQYNPATNVWTQKADFGGTPRTFAAGFSIANKGYIGTGCDDEFWAYNPETELPCIVPSGQTTVKITATSAKLKWDAVAGAEGYTVRYKVANTDGWKYGTTYNSSKPISGLLPNTVYKWEVRTFCQVAPDIISDWSSRQKFTTASLRMNNEALQQVSFQIYPNPAEDHATIQYTLPQASHVYIKVYDVSGKEIATLLDEDVEQGDHSLMLNTNHFPKGVYIVKMISPAVLRDGIVRGTPYGENQKLIVQ